MQCFMRILIKQLFSTDPSTFIGAFGMWAIIVGASVAGPGDTFALSPAWLALSHVSDKENMWGWLMIVNGLLLLASLRMSRIPQRASIALVSAVMWFVLGTSMVLNAWVYGGFFSIAGSYSVWCSIQAMVAVEQWVAHTPGIGGD